MNRGSSEAVGILEHHLDSFSETGNEALKPATVLTT